MADIVYFEDILKDVAEEFDADEKQIEEILKLNLKYVNELTKDPNTISIALPKLGVLHFNEKKAKTSYTHSAAYKKYVDVVDSQLDIVSDVHSEEKDLVHSRSSYYSLFKRFFFKERSERIKTKKIKVFEKLEKKQNKINE